MSASLSFTCSCDRCRRHVTIPYLQSAEDAYWRATEKGWSFLYGGRDAAGRIIWLPRCPSHPFFRFWTLDRDTREAAA